MLSSMSNSPAYAMLFQELYSASANTWHRLAPALALLLSRFQTSWGGRGNYVVWDICF